MNLSKTHIFFLCLLSLALFSEERAIENEVALNRAPRKVEAPEEGYTINYNTVSIIEYIRFASKICKANFLFNEEDLDFTVNVVSDAPITPENVMATLLQLLRIHGLMLLEQDNNLVIHKSGEVKQLATLVTENGQGGNAPIVTRIFRIKNARAESIAAIVQPMISSSAILETSPETRQIILTDVRANVDKVASLIEIVDSPHTPLDIKSFEAQHNKPEYLIEIAGQIMGPIAQGNPFLLVPQTLANSVFIVSTPELVERAIEVLQSLDIAPKRELLAERVLSPENVSIYQVEHRSAEDVYQGLQNIAKSLQQAGIPEGDLIETMKTGYVLSDSNSILLVGSVESLAKVKEFLLSLDKAGQGVIEGNFFVYRPQNKSAVEVEKAILEMAKNLQGSKVADEALIEAIRSVRINSLTHTLVFSGEERTFPRIKELLAAIDSSNGRPTHPSPKYSFFLYKVQRTPLDLLDTSLKNFAKSLDKSNGADEPLIEAIQSLKQIKETNSLLFTGPETTLKRLQDLVSSFDSGAAPASDQFLIYKPKHISGDHLSQSLMEVADDLQADGLPDPALLRTLKSMKWIQSTNSLLFTGDALSIKKVEDLIAACDVQGILAPGMQKSFFLYQPQYTSQQRVEQYLNQVADNLPKKGEEGLLETLRSAKWIEPSRSFMFHGTETSLARVKEILGNFDTKKEEEKPGYYLYKVQHTTGDVIEDDLDKLAKNFQDSGLKDDRIQTVIENIRYIKETNSLLLTGEAGAIEEVKAIISDYDYPREEAGSVHSSFYMYKPQNIPAAQIEKSLSDIAANLKKADLADPNFLSAIDTAKYIETTNSLIFTGSPDALHKIQELIKEIDIPPQKHAPIQHVGKTTFLLYKLKYASGPQIINSLKAMTASLKKSGTADKEFIAALQGVKYVKETNSLLFTGTEEALTKVQGFVEQFDVTSLGSSDVKLPVPPVGASNFFLYRPQSLSGPDLERTMQDFAENLKMSGLADPDLFNAINSMRWVEKTQSLIFTGTPKALAQIKDLLASFDISSNLPHGLQPGGALEASIQAIDNTSFLVYKLQFHKGDEIQGALRQIAKDLILSNASVNQNLLNSINSIQWLEVTNSLLCSGDQETLTRLKELIKNLDIPLKQVFIEMLVIETSLTNALSFGLEWGGKYKYRNKFAGSLNNTPPPSAIQTSSSCLSQGMTNLNNFVPSASTVATPNLLPFQCGFDLGVIGQVIKHNGQTYLTLGSLLSAIQSDDESTVIMTPKIITQDGRTSSIFVGQNVPFVGSFINNTGSNTVQSANLEYRDIGLNLTVTPVLGNSDVVTLDINLDRTLQATDVTGQTITFGTQTAQGITTSKTNMQTTVHVPDKNFLILSGFANNSSVKSKTGLPCLGGLPLVGAAFSKSSDTVQNNNIVIFLRPHIISSLDDLRQVTADQEDFFRDQSGTPNLEHNYDEAMELIKSIDDD